MNQPAIGLLCIAALGACSSNTDANLENFTAATQAYLARKGDLCLAKTSWPIDVTQHEVKLGARNALQMPVLEKLGLVRSSVITAASTGQGAAADVRRYELTDAGKKYYLHRETRSAAAGGAGIEQGDFCAARLSLDKVVGWETLRTASGGREAVVSYTYKVDAAPWTQDADIRKVFPMVDYIVRGQQSAQLKEAFTLTERGWTAKD